MSADTDTSAGYRVQFTDDYGCRRERAVTFIDSFTESDLPGVLLRWDNYWRRGGHRVGDAERVETDSYADAYAGYVYAPEVETPLAGYGGIEPMRETRDGWVGYAERVDVLDARGPSPEEAARRRLEKLSGWLRRHSEWNTCDCSRPDHPNGRVPHDDGCAVLTEHWYPARPEPWADHHPTPSLSDWLISTGDAR